MQGSVTTSGNSSHYPSSRGPSSRGLSSTGSMQTAVPYAGMMSPSMPHYLDWGKHQRNSGDLSGLMTPSYISSPHVSSMHGSHAQGPGMAPTQAPHWHDSGVRLVDGTGLEAMHALGRPPLHQGSGGMLPSGAPQPPLPGNPLSPGRNVSWDSSSSPAP